MEQTSPADYLVWAGIFASQGLGPGKGCDYPNHWKKEGDTGVQGQKKDPLEAGQSF